MGEQLKNSKAVSPLVAMVIAVAFGVTAALLLRYGFLESEAQAALCRNGGEGVLCSLRAALGWSIHYQLFGLGAALLATAAWLPRLRWLALLALPLAAAGLMLYNTTYGAVGFVIALLVLVR